MNLINNIALYWWHWMGAMFWQVSLLIIFISLLDYLLLKKVWPPVRYAVWILVLVKLFIPPDWSLSSGIVPKIQPLVQKQLPANWIKSPAFRPAAKTETPTPPAGHPQSSQQAAGVRPEQKPEAGVSPIDVGAESIAWQVYTMGIWILGILIFSGFLLTKIHTLRKWHDDQKERQNIPDWFHKILTVTAERIKLDKLPAIVYSEKAVTPAVYGLFHPVLLLPANYFDQLSEEDAEHVLLHELAHLKRGDLWMNSICLLVQVLYWFNPLLIWTRKQLKHVCEMCCDLTVAGLLKEKTPAYRKTLLTTARGMLTESLDPGMGLLGVFEEPFHLLNRLKWLEKGIWKDKNLMFVTATIVFVFMAGLVLPMAVSEDRHNSETDIKSGDIPKTVEHQTNDPSWMRDLKKQIGGDFDFIISAKETEPFYAVTLLMRGPMELLNDAMYQLQSYMQQKRIAPTGPSFIRQLSNMNAPEPEADNIWEVGYPVATKLSVKAPFVLKKFPREYTVYTRLDGTFDQDAYNKEIAEYLFKYNLVATNPVFIYFPDKLYNSGRHKPIWEIQTPIVKSDKPFPKVPFTTKWTEAIVALILPMRGSYDNEQEALERLQNYLKEINVEPIGDPFFRYLNNSEFLPEEDLMWQVGYAVPKGTKASPPFEIKYIPEQLIVCAEFTYDYKDILLYVNSFALSFVIEGYRDIGYPMRIFKSGDLHGVALNEFRIPVRKARYYYTKLPRF